jgi:hypothetical protein
LILWQLRKVLTPSICAVDSEKWYGDDGYNLADNDDLLELSPDLDDSDDDEDELKEGDHILYTVFALVEEIHAGSTVSQRPVEFR